ncbi:MAG TPA: potassium channel family protein [Phycisphaerae bacterium]|nr:potassium channel family protein [Phycisphaerae bacterium]
MSSGEASTSPEPGLLKRLSAGRFFWLLVALVLFILFAGETPDTAVGRWVSVLPFVMLLVGTTFAARGGKKLRAATFFFNLLFLCVWCAYYLHPTTARMFLVLLVMLVCLFLALLSTLRFVLSAGQVTADHIMGAICSYSLIAMLFGTIYCMQWLASPATFKGLDEHPSRPWADLLYFSFTTLSTVGYGDIIPATSRSRSVVIVEQMTGTFYVAVLIARLASLYPPPSRKEDASRSS